jgi:ankyrin repeat protein
MTEILLKAKADVNATDDTGRTPLIFATRESCSKGVELLIKAPGIRCLTKDRSQKTALDYASDDSRLEVDGASQTIMGLILFSGKS